jgi:hypothetical protein
MLFVAGTVMFIALLSSLAVAEWLKAHRREREAYYRSETLKRLAETQGAGINFALEFLREEDRIATRRRREGLKLGGLITIAVGLGLMFYFRADMPPGSGAGESSYLMGLIPLLVGVALLAYAYVLGPKE